jgi:hypothetical protein
MKGIKPLIPILPGPSGLSELPEASPVKFGGIMQQLVLGEVEDRIRGMLKQSYHVERDRALNDVLELINQVRRGE